jgi:hypothetical protein
LYSSLGKELFPFSEIAYGGQTTRDFFTWRPTPRTPCVEKEKVQRGADANPEEEEEESERGKELPFYTFHSTLMKADSGKLRSALPFTFYITLPYLKMRFTY